MNFFLHSLSSSLSFPLLSFSFQTIRLFRYLLDRIAIHSSLLLFVRSLFIYYYLAQIFVEVIVDLTVDKKEIWQAKLLPSITIIVTITITDVTTATATATAIVKECLVFSVQIIIKNSYFLFLFLLFFFLVLLLLFFFSSFFVSPSVIN